MPAERGRAGAMAGSEGEGCAGERESRGGSGAAVCTRGADRWALEVPRQQNRPQNHPRG